MHFIMQLDILLAVHVNEMVTLDEKSTQITT